LLQADYLATRDGITSECEGAQTHDVTKEAQRVLEACKFLLVKITDRYYRYLTSSYYSSFEQE
jgi:hypothetical protein